jgi:hypothetical protein
MRDKENLLKAISFYQKGASMYSLHLSRDVSTKWQTVTSSYIPGAVVPAAYVGFLQVKSSQSFSIG